MPSERPSQVASHPTLKLWPSTSQEGWCRPVSRTPVSEFWVRWPGSDTEPGAIAATATGDGAAEWRRRRSTEKTVEWVWMILLPGGDGDRTAASGGADRSCPASSAWTVPESASSALWAPTFVWAMPQPSPATCRLAARSPARRPGTSIAAMPTAVAVRSRGVALAGQSAARTVSRNVCALTGAGSWTAPPALTGSGPLLTARPAHLHPGRERDVERRPGELQRADAQRAGSGERDPRVGDLAGSRGQLLIDCVPGSPSNALEAR